MHTKSGVRAVRLWSAVLAIEDTVIEGVVSDSSGNRLTARCGRWSVGAGGVGGPPG